jgi:hypothetical protein
LRRLWRTAVYRLRKEGGIHCATCLADNARAGEIANHALNVGARFTWQEALYRNALLLIY